jgi:hypothetical protein
MKYIWLVFLLCLCACSIKTGDKEISFMQMQAREGSASIYSTKLYGCDIGFPIPGVTNGVVQFRLGYVGETKGVIPIKKDGDLPDVCIDITQETDGAIFSDTYSTGKSSQLYQQEKADAP